MGQILQVYKLQPPITILVPDIDVIIAPAISKSGFKRVVILYRIFLFRRVVLDDIDKVAISDRIRCKVDVATTKRV